MLTTHSRTCQIRQRLPTTHSQAKAIKWIGWAPIGGVYDLIGYAYPLAPVAVCIGWQIVISYPQLLPSVYPLCMLLVLRRSSLCARLGEFLITNYYGLGEFLITNHYGLGEFLIANYVFSMCDRRVLRTYSVWRAGLRKAAHGAEAGGVLSSPTFTQVGS